MTWFWIKLTAAIVFVLIPGFSLSRNLKDRPILTFASLLVGIFLFCISIWPLINGQSTRVISHLPNEIEVELTTLKQQLEDQHSRGKSDSKKAAELQKEIEDLRRLVSSIDSSQANNKETDPEFLITDWLGVWQGNYDCSDGNIRVGTVEWRVSFLQNNRLRVKEFTKRNGTQNVIYVVEFTRGNLLGTGSDQHGTYTLSAQLLSKDKAIGSWPGYTSCGNISVRKLQ